jgi:type III pantothenate kinase
LALLGAEKLYPEKNILIIDCGTATTVDVLDKTGTHLGGWILPGFAAMHQGVIQTTSKVLAELNVSANSCFANNTSDGVNHGCWAAIAGAVLMAQQQCLTQGVEIEQLIITGGSAVELTKLINSPAEVIEDLIFHGLLRYCH